MNWLKSIWMAMKTPPAPGGGLGNDPALGNFTPRAAQVLELAREEARRLHHNFVGTEHVLLGLLRLGQGTAVKVLAEMGLDLQKVRAEVERSVGPGPAQELVGHIPYTPRVKAVLALADKEARALNHTYVGTEHILLGLVREGQGVAARVLQQFGIDMKRTRTEVLKELDPNLNASEIFPEPPEDMHTPKPSTPQGETVDISKRYDVYCREIAQHVSVYRNVVFKQRRKLLRSNERFDAGSDFVELEQANGQTVYLSLFSIFRFCEHGTEVMDEVLRPREGHDPGSGSPNL